MWGCLGFWTKTKGWFPPKKKIIITYGVFLHDEVRLCQPLPINIHMAPSKLSSGSTQRLFKFSLFNICKFINHTMRIKGLNELPRPWMSLFRVNTYMADYIFHRWPHQDSPTHMLFLQWMRHRQSSIKQWDPSYVPSPWTWWTTAVISTERIWWKWYCLASKARS